MFSSCRILLLAATALLTLPLTGCDNLFGLAPEGTALVQVNLTHHATPTDGQFPDTSTALGNREFDNDEGWTVTLTEAFIVTANVSLQTCDGKEIGLERYWGAVPENLSGQDLDLSTFGGTEVSPGHYCGVTVTYGPFSPAGEAARQHEMPEDAAALDGTTILLTGYATRGDDLVEFEVRNTERLVVDLPITEADGGPLVVSGEEYFPVELTLSKTYDRFFDGIDFSQASSEDLSANTLAVLAIETRLTTGTAIAAD
ncbi:MAG: hypothetical protein JKY37_12220 [Nannocystaceae bacterium]|nr:hypothetical protein [Nannocystaceae bacterium]